MPVEAELWLDYEPSVQRLPGIALGPRTLDGPAREAVTRWHREGVRCLRLPEPVLLCADAPAASVAALLLVREATGQGLAVRWTGSCPDGCGAADGRYHHFYPPERLIGAGSEALARWRGGYFPGKCLFRRGPGFVEVRDRRSGALELYTIDEPGQLEQLPALLDGTPAEQLPAGVRRDFTEAGLITEQGGLAWWLPMGVRRWPFPSTLV
ncbi:DUF5825 family protein [Kitasatospora sp. NPDC006697]|uniref:DUF5825 family protein n=1 Tax=Kitasatospora sp. NPDC006697 TaxID=3364020 RepID=UPI00369DD6A9